MKNKRYSIFKYIFLSLFAIFLALYFSVGVGYFDYINGKKVALTEKQIQEFEKDVAAGKEVDALTYVEEKGNYQNRISKLGLSISNVSYKIINKSLKLGFKVLEKLTQTS
jgi:hypothetical protein